MSKKIKAQYVLRLYSIIVISSITFLASPALADETKTKIFVANTNPEFVVNSPSNKLNTYTVEVLLEGQQAGEIVVEFVDYVSGPNGRITLPGGTAPNSLQNAIELTGKAPVYLPNGESQIFELVFRPKASIKPAIYSGGLKIGFLPFSDDSEFSTSTIGVVKNLLVTPFGGATTLPNDQLIAADLIETQIISLERSSFIDSLLPDIPGVVNHGPVEIRSVIKNIGKYPLFVEARWQLSSQDDPLAIQEAPSQLLAGDASLTHAIQSVYVDPATNRSLNVLPGMGIVTVETQLTSSLTGVEIGSKTYSQAFLVLLWKEPLSIALILLATLKIALSYRAARISSEEKIRTDQELVSK